MRIVGGSRRGKVLPAFGNLDIRPTTDFAKEGLFNILHHRMDLEDILFLDLFAGTGGMSYEFMSRGASGGTMVDSNTGAHSYRAKVMEQLDWKTLHNVRADVFKYLRNCGEQFDIIFADPPYDLPEIAELPDHIFENDLLKAEGIFILEHPIRTTFGKHPRFTEHRKYGAVNFSFFS